MEELFMIPYGRQTIDEDDINAVVDVLKSDYLTTGPKIAEFEQAVASYTGAKYAVAISNGTSALHAACFAAGIGRGDEVITTPLTFAASANCVLYCGGTPVFADVDPYTYNIDPEDIRKKITDKTKMIVVVNPSNPTGGVFSRETLEKLSEIAIKHDLLVIADEIYSQLVYDGTEHVSIASLPGMKERTITLGGFSKAYSMTGWRLGYLCAPVGIIQACVRVHQYTVTCASSFVQEAALTALSDCAEDVEAMRKEYQRRKDYVVKALNEIDGISCNNPHGAFYIFVNIKSLGMTSMEVAEYLLDNAKIALVPGSAFGSEGEGYLRISYACSYEDLQEACARIKKAVEELKNK